MAPASSAAIPTTASIPSRPSTNGCASAGLISANPIDIPTIPNAMKISRPTPGDPARPVDDRTHGQQGARAIGHAARALSLVAHPGLVGNHRWRGWSRKREISTHLGVWRPDAILPPCNGSARRARFPRAESGALLRAPLCGGASGGCSMNELLTQMFGENGAFFGEIAVTAVVIFVLILVCGLGEPPSDGNAGRPGNGCASAPAGHRRRAVHRRTPPAAACAARRGRAPDSYRRANRRGCGAFDHARRGSARRSR